jgi:thymidylate synthase (FAD)
LGKHQVGLVWNEVSRRYVSDEPEFYTPEVWRKAAANVKQGSSDEAVESIGTSHAFYHVALSAYKHLLTEGVCPEQARMVLPQSMYTEWYWTGNLYAFANVFIQRTDSHAQKETQQIAHQIGSIISPLFPVSWKALTQ